MSLEDCVPLCALVCALDDDAPRNNDAGREDGTPCDDGAGALEVLPAGSWRVFKLETFLSDMQRSASGAAGRFRYCTLS